MSAFRGRADIARNYPNARRLLTMAEGRRNAIFREIDRRRMTFAQALRGSVGAIENAEFETIEPKTIASNSARNQDAA